MYDLRSVEDEEGLTEEELLDGLSYLFCALETLSLADMRGVVVPTALLEGLAVDEGLASVLEALLDGRDVVGLSPSFLFLDGAIPAEEGRWLLFTTCKPSPLGLGPLGLRPPPPGCG